MNENQYKNAYPKTRSCHHENERKAEKQAKRKGQEQERLIVQAFKDDGIPARVGNQRQAVIGGCGEGDIETMHTWFFESKCDDVVTFPAYVKQLRRDCPKHKHGGVIFNHAGTLWMAIPFEKRAMFAQDYCEAKGYVLEPIPGGFIA